MEEKTYYLNAKCPFRFEKYIDKRKERCRSDCAWLMFTSDGNSAACCIPWFISERAGGLVQFTDVEEMEEGK